MECSLRQVRLLFIMIYDYFLSGNPPCSHSLPPFFGISSASMDRSLFFMAFSALLLLDRGPYYTLPSYPRYMWADAENPGFST